MPITCVAPARRASCTANNPIAPSPNTATRSPSLIPASRITSAITTGSRQTAASGESPFGSKSAFVSVDRLRLANRVMPKDPVAYRKPGHTRPDFAHGSDGHVPQRSWEILQALSRVSGQIRTQIGIVRSVRGRIIPVPDQLGPMFRRRKLGLDPDLGRTKRRFTVFLNDGCPRGNGNQLTRQIRILH